MKMFNISVGVKRYGGGILAMALVFNSLALAMPAKAASEPEIDKVVDRGRRSVELRIDDDRFLSDKVRIKVTVTNVKTGKLVKTSHFTKTLNSEGETEVRIGGLSPNTEYRFKLRVKEFGKNKDYKGSDSKTVKTRS